MFTLQNQYISRKIWAGLCKLNNSMYPDLNGTWEGEVTFESNQTIRVSAVIRHSLAVTEIDLHGETVKSITLEATPIIEKGQKKLYYVYRSMPKDPKWPSYSGTTLFDLRRTNGGLELSGNYYTARQKIGSIRLKQVSLNPNIDISLY